MKFKPGVLVIVLRATNRRAQHLVGRIYALGQRCDVYPNSWDLEGARIYGCLVSCRESDMRPLDNPGDDEIDHLSLRLPSPRQEVTV